MRQRDVAAAARVSQATISRAERGHLSTLPLNLLRSIGGALEVRLELVPSWRGGELDRVLNARHSALHEELARRLAALRGWEWAAEVSFSIFGERGVVDVLGFHAATSSLLVVEIKSELVDPAGLVGQVDRYRRLAPAIARERGWVSDSVSVWVVVGATDMNRRRVIRHRALLRQAFPVGGPSIRRWLLRPCGRVAALSFLAYPIPRNGTRRLTASRRVRHRGRPRRAEDSRDRTGHSGVLQS